MLSNYLSVGAILFALGALGFIARRNLIVMFLSAEMMLQGVSLNLVAFSNAWGNWHGQIFTIFSLTIAAAEAAIALALILTLYRRRGSLDVSLWQELREPDQPRIAEDPAEAPPLAQPRPKWPALPPAGIAPPPPAEEQARKSAYV
jgi:NADH-quinone oxidoreductase subunit K